MSKKKLKDGLESLFADYAVHNGEQQPAAGTTDRTAAVAVKEKPIDGEKRSSGKKFASDLENFLQSAFEDSFDRQRNKGISELEETALKKRSHRPLSGLDSLIRTTVDPREMHFDEQQPTRRLTIVFDEKKLSKLKEIARLEKTVLRDIIDEIVAGFIMEYERKKKQS